MKLKIPKKSRIYFMYAWGLVLIFFACLFWFFYGFGILGLKSYGISIIPPITSIIIFVGVGICWFLVSSNKSRIIVFGEHDASRTRILDMLGIIFTGFGLVVTLLWSLMGNITLTPYIVYIQSSLLVLLFFFIAFSFYIMLSKVNT